MVFALIPFLHTSTHKIVIVPPPLFRLTIIWWIVIAHSIPIILLTVNAASEDMQNIYMDLAAVIVSLLCQACFLLQTILTNIRWGALATFGIFSTCVSTALTDRLNDDYIGTCMYQNYPWRQQTRSGFQSGAQCVQWSEPLGPASDNKHSPKNHVATQGTAPENHFQFAAATKNLVRNRLQ